MKKVNISVPIDDEKLDALVFFMGKDNTSPQNAMEDALEKLYTKYVPADTRDYIESRMPAATAAKPKRPAKPAPKPQAVEAKPAGATASPAASAPGKETH